MDITFDRKKLIFYWDFDENRQNPIKMKSNEQAAYPYIVYQFKHSIYSSERLRRTYSITQMKFLL